MRGKKNNINNKKDNVLCGLLLSQKLGEKNGPGIHPDTIVGVFKAKDVREGMTISGINITKVIESKSSEFIIIKKDTFYKNIPSRDTILSPGQKIRIDDKDKKVETLVDNKNIVRLIIPETETYFYLSNKKEYMYINNIQVVCGNDKKNDEDNKEEFKQI
jgi:hypothetical protein